MVAASWDDVGRSKYFLCLRSFRNCGENQIGVFSVGGENIKFKMGVHGLMIYYGESVVKPLPHNTTWYLLQ